MAGCQGVSSYWPVLLMPVGWAECRHRRLTILYHCTTLYCCSPLGAYSWPKNTFEDKWYYDKQRFCPCRARGDQTKNMHINTLSLPVDIGLVFIDWGRKPICTLKKLTLYWAIGVCLCFCPIDVPGCPSMYHHNEGYPNPNPQHNNEGKAKTLVTKLYELWLVRSTYKPFIDTS